MRPISDNLLAILKSRLQIGASGFHSAAQIQQPGQGAIYDDFVRSEAGGWGTASTGEVWDMSGAGVTFSVDGASGVAVCPPAVAFLAFPETTYDLAGPSITTKCRWKFSALPAGAGQWSFTFGDWNALAYVQVVDATLVLNGGTPQAIDALVPDTWYVFEFTWNATSSTLWARLYPDGNPAAAWVISDTFDGSRVDPGVAPRLGGWSDDAITFTVDQITVANMAFADITGIRRISIDKSRQTDADAFTIECELSPDTDFATWLPLAICDATVDIWQWYGDVANKVRTFRGFLDNPDQPRDPSGRTIVLSGRCYMKKAIVQGAIVTAPQGASEAGAVRTADNYVFLDSEVSAIVTALLAHLDFPAASVAATSYFVQEFVGADRDSFAKMWSDLAGLVGYVSFADEDGTYHFESPTANVVYDDTGAIVPDIVLRAGGPTAAYPDALDMVSIEHGSDDYDLATRIKITGSMSSAIDAFTQTWMTSAVPKPTGIVYDPADPGNLLVVSGSTKKIYKVRQSDRAIIGVWGPITGCYSPAGLSTDPSDASILWLLDAPYKVGSGAACTVKKLTKASLAVAASYTLPAGFWVDIKADGSYLWLANWSTGQFHTRSKADGSAVSSYTIGGRSDPTGIAIDGTTIYFFFNGSAAVLRVDSGAPTVILQTISTSGTGIIGGEVDVTTHTDLYACSDTVGRLWKYALTAVVSNAVSAVVIAGVGYVNPEPTVPTGPIELGLCNPIRRIPLELPVITSLSQAAETAMGQLALLEHARHVMTAGILGNPAIQKGDIALVLDNVMGESGLWVVDTYRTEMVADATYLGILGLTAWGG